MSDEGNIFEDELERVRILNALGMYEGGGMSQQVGPDGRMRLLPLLCKTILSIRKLNRKLIERLEERSWKSFDEQRPAVGDEILVQPIERVVNETARIISIIVREDDEFVGVTRWMKVPE
jgi:hypothetical protein